MSLTRPTEVRRILEEIGVRPSKAMGQNFLIDRNTVDIILKAADLSAAESILEVGPGLGVLTEELLPRARCVTAVEKDARLAAYLERRFKDSPGLTVIRADMLDVALDDLPAGSGRIGKVVSNLPYSSGTRILVELILAQRPPDCMVLTMQQEVVQRMTASASEEAYGLLSVWAQVDYRVEMLRAIRPTCFWPRPEVTSAIVRLIRLPNSVVDPARRSFFRALTRHAFEHRRKQLVSILKRAPAALRIPAETAAALLCTLGLDEKARPENLSPDAWARLANEAPRI